MNTQQALDKLFALHQFGIKLGLDKIIHLLNHLGNPQDKIKTVHIAGSNGKGSTASFIASILMEAGYKVGLYTSPHFVRFNERVRINGIEIPDDYIARFMTQLDLYIDKHQPTFFELTTALAFKYFYENDIDYAIIETGLGGRLDATNTIKPLASIITNISLEHTNILGEKIEQIAYEKACIIKNNIPVFTGLLPENAEKVIADRAKNHNCRFLALKNYTTFFEGNVILKFADFNFNINQTPLRGIYQAVNAALAVHVVHNVFKISDNEILTEGLKNVILNTGIQGRYEIYNPKPRVIFDAAHNFDGLKVFLEEFKNESVDYNQNIVIFGCMKDKKIGDMLSLLNSNFNKIHITSINYERAATIEELRSEADERNIKVYPLNHPAQFISDFIETEINSCLVVLGSIYLIGNIKGKLLELKRT